VSTDLEIIVDTWNFISASFSDDYKLMAIKNGASSEEAKYLNITNIKFLTQTKIGSSIFDLEGNINDINIS
jgi:hypothetical protein